MICAPETSTFALQMTKCDTAVLFIMYWSWMAPRWLLHFCAMSTNALCAHVITVSWIKRMSLTPIATPNLSRDTESVKREVDAARSEHLDDDGEVKELHKDEVNQYHARYLIRFRN
jgi:hypothetical protein